MLLSTIEYSVTAIVCLLSAVIIQRIFKKEGRRTVDAKSIDGIKWFGLAIFSWGIGAFVNFLLVTVWNVPEHSQLIIYWGVFISLANSLFIILSLPSIEHNRPRNILVRTVQRFTTREFIGIYCAVLGMIAFVFIATSYNNAEISNNFIWLIDIPISVLVALALLSELNKAFADRNMKFMYLPTLSLFALILIAISYRIIPQDRAVQVIDQRFWAMAGSITAISFKFLFILLFSILLYSWKFLSETEAQQSLAIKLTKENNALSEELKRVKLSSESHLDTIATMKKELTELKESSKVVLSDRQKEVLGYLGVYGKEKSYPEIAAEMNISLDGFQTHIHQIKKILNISGTGGKQQLIAFAHKNKLTDSITSEKNQK
ncbi:helix-turn-helix transcriptional regulator [Luteirhabdus pelagi]|uniref:helix-turn-helix transcriptional regulator n=1 Tax=Luteirhabdus pelagi TaxID=2792783 RepID=UPI001F380943|nr:hypothetical protein [Luteirhabdus pelagi]